MMYLKTIQECDDEWRSLSGEFELLETAHKEYQEQLQRTLALQTKCVKAVKHQHYRMAIIGRSTNRLSRLLADTRPQCELLQKNVVQRKAQLYEMENCLPTDNDLYLQIILGSVNVSILNKNDRFLYKNEYEKFKLLMNAISMGVSFLNLLLQNRILDLVFMFMLVWYYCTLTIRESILRVNGSRIRGWWRAHHFVSCALSAILLVWPVGPVYYVFRPQFHWFNVYLSSVQYMQFVYQRGCLYRMKALGERCNMDHTVEGFHSWMWRGLSFLLPLLYIAYAFEFYNAFTLYQLSSHPEATWQVLVLSLLFLLLAVGNTFTTSVVLRQKINESWKLKYRFLVLDSVARSHKTLHNLVAQTSVSAPNDEYDDIGGDDDDDGEQRHRGDDDDEVLTDCCDLNSSVQLNAEISSCNNSLQLEDKKSA